MPAPTQIILGSEILMFASCLKWPCRERKYIVAIKCLHLFFDHLGMKCFSFNVIASDMITGIISVKETCYMSQIRSNL